MIEENIDWIKGGGLVDFKDKQGEWQVGYVLSVQKSTVKIRLDGWASKYDEVITVMI